MYASLQPATDARSRPSRYVDQVERAGVSPRLTELLTRLRRIEPWRIDLVLGTVFVVAGLVSLYAPDPKHTFHPPDGWAVFLTVLAAAPYYVRRRAPLLVLAVTSVPVVILAVAGYPTGMSPNWLLVGMYTVAAYTPPLQRLLGAATVGIGLAVVMVGGAPDLTGTDIALNYALYATAYFVGSTIRNRRLYAENLEARAETLERERDEEAERAVAHERLRIAQELHDVAHSMGVIAVQAGVGAHVIDSDPTEAKKSLEAIARTSRSTLTEIRRMLGVLREDEGAQYAPAPGLADLDRLVREVSGAGVAIEVEADGERNDLPPGVDFTAYRIMQEALTNVLKHAGPARVQIHIDYEPDALAFEVSDDGRGVNGRSNGGGHGLMGMRERVAVYGGAFEAGPRPGGGFRVRARLPYGVEA
jgi:signal transduction histidine kinase